VQAEQFVDLVMAQRDLLRFGGLWICIDDAFDQLAAGGFENELRASAAGPFGDADVRAALEAVARLAAQAEGFAGASDVRRGEIRALDEHVLRRIVDLRVLPA